MNSTTSRAALRAKYERLVGGVDPPPKTIEEMASRWLTYCHETYPIRERRCSNTFTNARDAIRELTLLYGDLRPDEITMKMAEAVRCAMAANGLSRRTIHDRMSRIRTMYRWAATRGWAQTATVESIKLPPIRPGRTISGVAVKQNRKVQPVAWDDVQAVLNDTCIRKPVKAMIRLQWWTAMRPGEVVSIRPVDVNTMGRIWTYAPPNHKTTWKERDRTVYLGPQSMAILRPWLDTAVTEPCFPYTPQTYYRAILRACDRLAIPRWHPNRLRHSALTRLRQVAGSELAQIIAGHANISTTEIYAERDRESAQRVMLEHG